MTNQQAEVHLGKGIGPLTFGMSMAAVKAAIGEPEEIEKSEPDDEFDHQAWNYLEQGFSLYFDQEDDNRLSCIETDREGLTLFGEPILEKSVADIRALMSRHGYTQAQEEAGDEGELQLSYEQEMIDFYFVDDQLLVINFGVFIDEETHDVKWPA